MNFFSITGRQSQFRRGQMWRSSRIIYTSESNNVLRTRHRSISFRIRNSILPVSPGTTRMPVLPKGPVKAPVRQSHTFCIIRDTPHNPKRIFYKHQRPKYCNEMFNLSLSTSTGPPPYEERLELFDLDSKEELLDVSKEDECIFLDVRSEGEQTQEGTLCGTTYNNRVVHAPVTMKDFSSLKSIAMDPLSPLYVENAKDVPIIVFCGVGRRANAVQKILEENGYRNVYNAGGFCDLDFLERVEPNK